MKKASTKHLILLIPAVTAINYLVFSAVYWRKILKVLGFFMWQGEPLICTLKRIRRAGAVGFLVLSSGCYIIVHIKQKMSDRISCFCPSPQPSLNGFSTEIVKYTKRRLIQRSTGCSPSPNGFVMAECGRGDHDYRSAIISPPPPLLMGWRNLNFYEDFLYYIYKYVL